MFRPLIAIADRETSDKVVAALRIEWPAGDYRRARDVRSALAAALVVRPSVVVLDRDLLGDDPDWSHVGEIRRLVVASVVVLVNEGDELAGMSGVDQSFDDYVVKPFGPLELVTRVKAALHSPGPVLAPGGPVECGARAAADFDDGYLQVDVARRRVRVRNRLVSLTATEFNLLAALVGQAGRVVSHRTLLARAWGVVPGAGIDGLGVHVRRLREKLEPTPEDPRYLLSEPGRGYRFARPSHVTGHRRPPWLTVIPGGGRSDQRPASPRHLVSLPAVGSRSPAPLLALADDRSGA